MTDTNFAVEKLCGRKIEDKKRKVVEDTKLETPVLFLVFNRLDTTKKVFEEIKKVKPKKLFIASDGWRNEEERKKVKEVRSYLLNNINWECQVKTLFRENNLGCRNATISAIDWFFHNVDRGIILEDDNLPNQDFFRFCEEMLNLYEYEERVMSIAGSNELGETKTIDGFLFSKFFFCWGWATWKRAWDKIEFDMKNYSIDKTGLNIFEKFYLERKFKDTYNKRSSWSTSVLYNQLKHRELQIVPKANLVENIGMNSGTNRFNKIDRKYLNKKRRKLKFPIRQPYVVLDDKNFNRNYMMMCFKRVIRKKLI